MKKSELIFSVILVPLDFLMLVFSGVVAYWLRFSPQVVELRPVIYELDFLEYLRILSLVAVFWLVIFAMSGLYAIRGTRKKTEELKKIFAACSIGVLIIIIAFFFRRELFSSRFIVLAVWGLSIFFVSAARIAVRFIQRLLFSRGIGVHRAALIGNGKIGEAISQELKSRYKFGLSAVANFHEFSEFVKEELSRLVKEKKIDEVILVSSDLSRVEILDLLDFCKEHHIVFKYASDLFGTVTSHFEVDTIADVPLIEIKRTPLDGWGRILKRIVDIIGSFFGIILFSPILLIAAMAIKLDSPGPIIYKNRRMSKDGEFFAYKFRYMRREYCTGEEYGGKEAEQYEEQLIQEKSVRVGPLYKIQDDPRKTRVGKIIERLSIDELPQFFNVFLGNMSLVGPRPHQRREVEKYQRHHKFVLAIKPGITGMAQISGRSDLNFEDEVRLDSFYIENWSLWKDMIILFKTPFAIVRKRRN